MLSLEKPPSIWVAPKSYDLPKVVNERGLVGPRGLSVSPGFIEATGRPS